jgi:hypothetical protein
VRIIENPVGKGDFLLSKRKDVIEEKHFSTYPFDLEKSPERGGLTRAVTGLFVFRIREIMNDAEERNTSRLGERTFSQAGGSTALAVGHSVSAPFEKKV